jgi:hypothetical protein
MRGVFATGWIARVLANAATDEFPVETCYYVLKI